MDEKPFVEVVSCCKIFHKFHEENSDLLLRGNALSVHTERNLRRKRSARASRYLFPRALITSFYFLVCKIVTTYPDNW